MRRAGFGTFTAFSAMTASLAALAADKSSQLVATVLSPLHRSAQQAPSYHAKRAASRYTPHQSKRECARRLRQAAHYAARVPDDVQ